MEERISIEKAKQKLEHFCAYQERCHQDVIEKMYVLGIDRNDFDGLMVHLIEQQFLNEERFARSFARGKHRIKFWGIKRITTELKARKISDANIKLGLSEIDQEEYFANFHLISEKYWHTIQEKNSLKKRKKWCDYLLRKGWESDIVYEKLKALERTTF
jgi:regulatory protein